MTATESEPATTTRWEVAKQSGFRIEGEEGVVPLEQISDSQFRVGRSFRYENDDVERDIKAQLAKLGQRAPADEDEADARYRAAARYDIDTGQATDLASVPQFFRWFENTYGPHTLAAILHDELIRDKPNDGALGSDAVADRFFRLMLRSSGMPWLKRWVIWTAVAARSRWVAKWRRRIFLILWGLVAVVGIGCFVVATGRWISGGELTSSILWLYAAAGALPFVSAPLWGRQYGASIIAAIAGIFAIPAGLFALAGQATYRVIERAAGIFFD